MRWSVEKAERIVVNDQEREHVMKQFIKQFPLPVCGLALGLASSGNLLQTYGIGELKGLCGALAAVLLFFMLLKGICFANVLKEELKNPALAGISATFPMALMILSTYIAPLAFSAAMCIWLAAIILQLVIMVFFTKRFILNFKLESMVPSYFIVYVGLVAAAISSVPFEQSRIGAATFWFSLFSFFLLLIPVPLRYIRYPKVPQPLQPLFCIYAAPPNICLTGYLSLEAASSCGMVAVLYLAGLLSYLIAFLYLLRCLKLPFFPSYAAFSFPFVISAAASKATAGYLAGQGGLEEVVSIIAMAQTGIAVLLLAYVCTRYLLFFLRVGSTKE